MGERRLILALHALETRHLYTKLADFVRDLAPGNVTIIKLAIFQTGEGCEVVDLLIAQTAIELFHIVFVPFCAVCAVLQKVVDWNELVQEVPVVFVHFLGKIAGFSTVFGIRRFTNHNLRSHSIKESLKSFESTCMTRAVTHDCVVG